MARHKISYIFYVFVGGPCKYKVKKDGIIYKGFLLQVIMNDVKECYNKGVYMILWTALLYFIFIQDEKYHTFSFINSVTQEFFQLYDRELKDNLVDEIVLVAHGSDGEDFLDETVK